MKSPRTRVHVYERGIQISRGPRSVASLHCHTHHSKELLNFIPHYAGRLPVISRMFAEEMTRYRAMNGKTIDFEKAWWTPPVSPRQVLEVETAQIAREFGLPALVSITDHDEIEAGLNMQVIDPTCGIPISMEWTVPYGRANFHLGIHNLPRDSAVELTREMLRYTRRDPEAMTLDALFAALNDSPGTLIILNHPFWDLEMVGADIHEQMLGAFLAEHVESIHAFEINGFRSWAENKAVLELGKAYELPVVTGGDRHGCRPNTLLNLTRATSFEELVAEIRCDRRSEVLLMPEYRESRLARTIEAVADVLRPYPGHPLNRPLWTDRIFVDLDGNGPRALSAYWKRGGPVWVRAALWGIRVLGSRNMNTALKLALADERVSYES